MIDVIVKRRTNLNGTLYQKGATLQMPLQQFNDLERTGRFDRASAKAAAVKLASKRAKKTLAKKTPAKKTAPAQAGVFHAANSASATHADPAGGASQSSPASD